MAKPIATNRKAYHNYTLTQTWECGVALAGSEVKSVRAGQVAFKDAFARIEKNEVYLYNLHISPYKEASYLNPEPDRSRKLLLHKNEIKKIAGQILERGKVLIPTKIYINARGFVKIEVAIGQGKKMYDKREDIKKREMDLSLRRTLRVRR